MEQKYQLGNEHGSIMWDIVRLLQGAEAVPVQMLPVEELLAMSCFHGDAAYAMQTDLSRPLLVAELCPGVRWLIDGNHRLYKAQATGIASLPCRVLPPEIHTRAIVGFDPAVYRAVTGSCPEPSR